MRKESGKVYIAKDAKPCFSFVTHMSGCTKICASYIHINITSLALFPLLKADLKPM